MDGPDSTIRHYSSAIDQFMEFCDSEGVPDHLRFPADEFILCAFAASSIGKHARSTAQSRLAALKAWHIAHNLEWKGSSRLCYVLNGIHNLAPKGSKHLPRQRQDDISTRPSLGLKLAIGQCCSRLRYYRLLGTVSLRRTTPFFAIFSTTSLLPYSFRLQEVRSQPSILHSTSSSYQNSSPRPRGCACRPMPIHESYLFT